VRKLLTGGEPLVRRGIMTLFSSLSRHLKTARWTELTLTTNGSQLGKYAAELRSHGVERINVSLDTLDPDKFQRHHPLGVSSRCWPASTPAQAAGLKVKINAVALEGVNEDELPDLVAWAMARMDITIIEVMPLATSAKTGSGNICRCRSCARASPRASRWRRSTTRPVARRAMCASRNRRPARLHHADDAQLLRSCSRVRITCTGTLYMACLGRRGRRGSALAAALLGKQRAALHRHRRSHHPQAQGP
jgi:cyclic pyranopterin phosphate synthase